jgi:propanol-preferring alcohol dehydrogenase
MKAAVVHTFRAPLTIEEVPTPVPGPDEVLVSVEASGRCHTDIHAAHGDWPVRPPLPFIPGHEGVGIVDAVGREVTRLQEGDRVAVPWLGYACGTCEHCVSGWETLCAAQRTPVTPRTAGTPSTCARTAPSRRSCRQATTHSTRRR